MPAHIGLGLQWSTSPVESLTTWQLQFIIGLFT